MARQFEEPYGIPLPIGAYAMAATGTSTSTASPVRRWPRSR